MTTEIRSNLVSWETGGRERLGTVFTEIQGAYLNSQLVKQPGTYSISSNETLAFQAFLISLLECCLPSHNKQSINLDHITALFVACLDTKQSLNQTTNLDYKDSGSVAQHALAAAIWVICQFNQPIIMSCSMSISLSINPLICRKSTNQTICERIDW